VIDTVAGAQRLTVYVLVEPFGNGADVYVRVRFDARRPHEVALAAFANPASVPLSRLVLTATMGNYARLRRLQLRDRVVEPGAVWSDHTGDGQSCSARSRVVAAVCVRRWVCARCGVCLLPTGGRSWPGSAATRRPRRSGRSSWMAF